MKAVMKKVMESKHEERAADGASQKNIDDDDFDGDDSEDIMAYIQQQISVVRNQKVLKLTLNQDSEKTDRDCLPDLLEQTMTVEIDAN